MIIKNKILIFLSVMLLSGNLTAQLDFNKYNVQGKDSSESIPSLQTPKKVHFGLQMGTSIGSYGKTPVYRNFVAPTVSYDLTERFTLNAGVMTSFGNAFQLYSASFDGGFLYPCSGTIMQNMVFASGSYKMNEKLTLFGGTYYEVNRLSLNDDQSKEHNFDNKGVSFGFEYKLSKSSSIQFEIQQGTGNPYQRSSFGNQAFGRRSVFSTY